MRLLQSTVERLLYLLILLVFSAIMVSIPFQINLYKRLDDQQQAIRQGVDSIRQEQQCIAAFFLQPDRASITVANLKICDDVIKSLPK